MSINFKTAFKKIDKNEPKTEVLKNFVEQFSDKFKSINEQNHFIAEWAWVIKQDNERSVRSQLREVYSDLQHQAC